MASTNVKHSRSGRQAKKVFKVYQSESAVMETSYKSLAIKALLYTGLSITTVLIIADTTSRVWGS